MPSEYNNSKSAVMVDGNLFDPFDVTNGVLQGDVLARFLLSKCKTSGKSGNLLEKEWRELSAGQSVLEWKISP